MHVEQNKDRRKNRYEEKIRNVTIGRDFIRRTKPLGMTGLFKDSNVIHLSIMHSCTHTIMIYICVQDNE